MRSEFIDVKSRAPLIIVAKKLRIDLLEPNYVKMHLILELKCPDLQAATTERFIFHTVSLFIKFDEVPTDNYLLNSCFETFNSIYRCLCDAHRLIHFSVHVLPQ